MTHVRVAVEVATVWTSPAAPRPVDRPAIADRPDLPAWLAALDRHPEDDRRGDGRLGLHGRVETQAVAGEPALVLEVAGDWVRVALPWQPSGQDPRGYPGWVRRAHLGDDTPDHGAPGGAPDNGGGGGIPAGPEPTADGAGVLELARRHLGLPYLWGGTSPLGYDCSGLVHHVWRALGVVVPRDADDQERAAEPVPRGSERAGDLYFFDDGGRGVTHVGIVVAPGIMVDAAEERGRLAEGPLDDTRLETLVAVGRLGRSSRPSAAG